MRERIASVIHETEFNTPGGNVSFELQVADAILAALPSMVKPLEWERGPHAGDAQAHGIGIFYKIIPYPEEDMAVLSKYESLSTLRSSWPWVEEAKAAAQADNNRRIMAAFGIEVSHE